MLWDLMRKVFVQERILLGEWRSKINLLIFKEKGDIQDCENYRGIKVTPHTKWKYGVN